MADTGLADGPLQRLRLIWMEWRCSEMVFGKQVAASSSHSPMFLAIAMLGWLAAVTPASAQTNEILLQERLISLPVYELLQQRGATTPEQRSQVIAEACRSGVLGPEDCVQRRR